MSRPLAPDVFAYSEVREFLKDLYEYRKNHVRGFSYRAFARKADLQSPNHLKRIIDGERDLTAEMAVRYAQVFGLQDDAARFFCDLAALGRAKTDVERAQAQERLAINRSYHLGHRLQEAEAAYHARWFIPVVRELAALPEFHADPVWIAGQLLPKITEDEATEALETLLALGMLTQDENGRLVRSDTVITTGAETRGQHIVRYHKAMLERAAASLDLVRGPQRDISSLTFALDDATFRELKSKLQAFRKELVGWVAEREAQGSRVVQLNMQLFPMSELVHEDKS